MSIPNRIWRVLRGRWRMADGEAREALAAELEEYELAESSRSPAVSDSALPSAAHLPQRASHPRSAPPGRSTDPLAADLALLGAPPASDMPTLDRIYQERLAELDREAGAIDPGDFQRRRTALSEAYERLRDAINTTETRFEKLEF